MEMKIKWHAPVALRRSRGVDQIYACDLDSIPEDPGIYLFARRLGTRVHVIYVGRAASIRKRIAQQLNTVKLMMQMHNAPSGTRLVIPGSFIASGSQAHEQCLPILEQAMIDHFMFEGHDLVNINGTNLKIKHVIHSTGTVVDDLVPDTVFLQ